MSAPSNVLPFARRPEPLAYASGVVPFDRSNPVHLRAWNTIFALGWLEQKSERAELGLEKPK